MPSLPSWVHSQVCSFGYNGAKGLLIKEPQHGSLPCQASPNPTPSHTPNLHPVLLSLCNNQQLYFKSFALDQAKGDRIHSRSFCSTSIFPSICIYTVPELSHSSWVCVCNISYTFLTSLCLCFSFKIVLSSSLPLFYTDFKDSCCFRGQTVQPAKNKCSGGAI